MLEYGSSSIKDIIDNSAKLLTSNLEWTVGTGGQVRRLANCYQ
ncbi:receptor binding protein 3 [Campylobacter phage F352]|uniref:Receptor binding protein 3 n=1 Tax=Campylobacter phage F352 TaxID=2794363 RepID=A0A7T3KDP0_9CAUD|nr:receptor binding protein 3 [Campylobacter phage F352]